MKIGKTKAWSRHHDVLEFLKNYGGWHTPNTAEVRAGVFMANGNMGRRLREDYNKGFLYRRIHKDGYVQYRWKGAGK